MNPFIYNHSSKEFRDAFIEVVCFKNTQNYNNHHTQQLNKPRGSSKLNSEDEPKNLLTLANSEDADNGLDCRCELCCEKWNFNDVCQICAENKPCQNKYAKISLTSIDEAASSKNYTVGRCKKTEKSNSSLQSHNESSPFIINEQNLNEFNVVISNTKSKDAKNISRSRKYLYSKQESLYKIKEMRRNSQFFNRNRTLTIYMQRSPGISNSLNCEITDFKRSSKNKIIAYRNNYLTFNENRECNYINKPNYYRDENALIITNANLDNLEKNEQILGRIKRNISDITHSNDANTDDKIIRNHEEYSNLEDMSEKVYEQEGNHGELSNINDSVNNAKNNENGIYNKISSKAGKNNVENINKNTHEFFNRSINQINYNIENIHNEDQIQSFATTPENSNNAEEENEKAKNFEQGKNVEDNNQDFNNNNGAIGIKKRYEDEGRKRYKSNRSKPN